MGHIFVPVGDDFVLADACAATGAPRHHIPPFVEPTVFMDFLEKAPDLIIIRVAEGEVGAAHFRQAQFGDDLLHSSRHFPLRPLDGDELGGVFDQFAF